MTMPETIWASYAGSSDLLHVSSLEYQGSKEYVLRSSVQGLIDAAFREAAAMAIARSGEGSGPMPHPYDKGYLAACKDIANAIRAKIGGAE